MSGTVFLIGAYPEKTIAESFDLVAGMSGVDLGLRCIGEAKTLGNWDAPTNGMHPMGQLFTTCHIF